LLKIASETKKNINILRKIEKEDKLKNLREEAKGFAAELDKAVKDAVDDALSRNAKSYGFAERALKKELETSTELLEQKIEVLDTLLELTKEENIDLKNRLEKANDKIENIAREAIRGAQQRVLTEEKK